MRRGAIILCGGQSTRMGTSKAMLPFGPETMLQRVVRLMQQVVTPDNMIVVAAAGQQLGSLPPGATVACDRQQERGPLEGLAVGLSSLQDRVDAVFATSCDVPLLVPAFVEQMFEQLAHYDIAVPVEEGFHHPLAAVYRPRVLPTIESLLAENRLRPVYLFEHHPTREVPVEMLHDVDPELKSLKNANRPEDYLSALKAAGLAPSEAVKAKLGIN